MKIKFALLCCLTLLTACGKDAPPATDGDYAKQLRLALIEAKPGDVIEIPEGTFQFARSLTLNTSGVTIRGRGMDKSILSFKGQTQGAEGLLVNASDFVISDLAIEDTAGDALKVNEGNNIVIRRVRTEWTNGPDTENGAYGIYPVQTENTLIDGSVAIGASDAGIYVGQSRNVVVKNSRAEYNVAGIEVENTIGADVHNNFVTNNTGGILVFNMPGLPQRGHSTRVYDNDVVENNTDNFAPGGTPVSSVPAGTGILINANDKVEIFGNRLADNETAHIIVSSFFTTGWDPDQPFNEDYDPYPETIFTYGNQFGDGGNSPDGLDLKALRVKVFGLTGDFPAVIWDGFANPEHVNDSGLMPSYAICIGEADAELLNADLPNDADNARVDMSNHRCTHEKLPAVVLPQNHLFADAN